MSTLGLIGVSAAIHEHPRSRMFMAIFESESGDSTSLKPFRGLLAVLSLLWRNSSKVDAN
jgi:hypothetical protein